MKKIGVALLGLGVVGGGTYQILTDNHQNIKKNQGLDIEVLHIIEKNTQRCQQMGVDMSIVSTDIDKVANDDRVHVVAEFFGGIEPAKSYLIKCLLNGKSVVTSNKELISKHWPELESAAKKGKAGVYFEASSVGGVPIIRTLTESLQGDNILSIKGIVNGTTNYILSKMDGENQDYATALKKAQELGYAESDPTADVEGFDSTYKLSILSTLAFRTKVPIDIIYREGISKVNKIDMDYGKAFGYTLKLLAIAKKVDGKIEARVHPTFIPSEHPMATVKGSFNAVMINGDSVGEVMLYGRGAGALPTGSAIVSDIVFAAKKTKHQYSSFKNSNDVSLKNFSKDFKAGYYMRMTIIDIPGALASVAKVFAKNHVSVKTMQQLSGATEDRVNAIFILHKTKESNIIKARVGLKQLECVAGIEAIIRVEE
ncbi:MAG: homoserine dehydrogenase [Clostridiales bacterium]|jgi:homoserine dehydrogenase|nr:homoserine dehydrogenase [Clostridiales bacterium]